MVIDMVGEVNLMFGWKLYHALTKKFRFAGSCEVVIPFYKLKEVFCKDHLCS